MTQDEIIEMARQAGWSYMEVDMDKQRLEAFAKLVAQHEREECAKECEAQLNEGECPERAQYCADAIRARGQA